MPKYIWAVDATGNVYEAKTKPNQEVIYHGYRLAEDDPQRAYVLNAWKEQ